MTETHPDDVAFPILDDGDIATLAEDGVVQRVRAGDHLYRAGDDRYDLHVVLSGAVDIVLEDDGCGQERLITRHGPGRFLGELNLVTGHRVFLTARVAEDGEVLRVPVEVVRALIATNGSLGEQLLVALMARRDALATGAAASLRLVGSLSSTDTRSIRDLLHRWRVPHEWVDVDRDDAVADWLSELHIGAEHLPIVVVAGGVLRNATPPMVSSHLGLAPRRPPRRTLDLLVVGAGPAGLAAAVYGASEGLDTLGIEALGVGGQAGSSSKIENYLGFPTGISGDDLTHRAVVQAGRLGAELAAPCQVWGLRPGPGHLVVMLDDGTEVAARSVIAATGARYRRLELDRLHELEGRCVYYAARESEAQACGGGPVVVVGGGNSAGQAAVFLARKGSHVTIVVRRSGLAASMSRYLIDRIDTDRQIDVMTDATIARLDGGDRLESVVVTTADRAVDLPCVGLFSFVGAEPSSTWLSGCAALDPHGFVLTDRSLDQRSLGAEWRRLGRGPLPYETSLPGLFAAGDVRSASTKRVAAAVGEGSAAVRSVYDHLTAGLLAPTRRR